MGAEDHKGYIPAGVETSMSGYSPMSGDAGAGTMSQAEHERALAVIKAYRGKEEEGSMTREELARYLKRLLLIGGFGKGKQK